MKFGGKLVTFGKFQASTANGQHPQSEHPTATVLTHDTHQSSRVSIQQVVTDTKLVENSQFLENALQTNNFNEYCNYKIETFTTASNEAQALIWRFIQVIN